MRRLVAGGSVFQRMGLLSTNEVAAEVERMLCKSFDTLVPLTLLAWA